MNDAATLKETLQDQRGAAPRENPEISGSSPKKAFFLFIDPYAEKWLGERISTHEYESFFLKDHRRVHDIFQKYPRSILFVNTLEPPRNVDLTWLINRFKEDCTLQETTVGVFALPGAGIHSSFPEIDFHIPVENSRGVLHCDETVAGIVDVLEENNARGMRNYIRARCDSRYHATFSIKRNGNIINGFIVDISSAGMLASFPAPQHYEPNTHIDDLQLRLYGTTCGISGNVMGSRGGDNKNCVILFDYSNAPLEKQKVQAFVARMLRKEMEAELESFL